MNKDVLGTALRDHFKGNTGDPLITYMKLNGYEEWIEDELPLEYLFRDFDGMPAIEQRALELCRGKVLDIGSGAGSHALYLQEKGMDVTGLDQSSGAIAVSRLRGLKKRALAELKDYSGTKFDTLLLLMNGIGLAGRMEEVDAFLQKLKSLLAPGGQVLIDSSDIIYMYEEDVDGGFLVPDNDIYYGEVIFKMEYKGQESAPFHWLYLDFRSLERAAKANGFICELVSYGEHYDYLARLIPAED